MPQNFDNISFTQLCSLINILGSTNSSDIDFIKSKYFDVARDYDATVEFLTNLSLVTQRDDQITISPELKSLFKEKNKTDIVRNLLLQKLIKRNSPYREELLRFFRLFELRGNDWACTPTKEQRLKYSGIRNLLIDMDCIEHDSKSGQYLFLSTTILLFEELLDSFAISRKEFSKLLEKREELGREAELRIIEYEKQRLLGCPNLISKIKHLADINVGAGFDILSFEGVDSAQPEMERLIEVKAVSKFSFKFFWSVNEVNKAKETGNNYYLYLLPVESKIGFDIDKLQIIQNPFLEIFNNSTKWAQSCESFCFRLI